MNQAGVAIQVADTIAGTSHPSLCWLTLVIINDPINNSDEDVWGLSDLLGTDSAEPPIDSEQVALLDIVNQDDPKPDLQAETSARVRVLHR